MIGAGHDAPWMRDALCVQVDPEMFYPAPGRPDHAVTAKALCRSCDVWAKCLIYALDYENSRDFKARWGIWGGTTPREREQLVRESGGRINTGRGAA